MPVGTILARRSTNPYLIRTGNEYPRIFGMPTGRGSSSHSNQKESEMSRTTQLVGLNDYAKKYLKRESVKKVGTQEITVGMFEEPVYGLICEEWVNNHTKMIYEEVVQDSPWSGGPMIFTHLKVTMVKINLETNLEIQRLDEGFFFSWMIDPSLEGEEYCEKTGRYYV